MIQPKFQEPTSEKWKKWRARAEKATQKLIADAARGAKIAISETLYKHCKDELSALFHGKCAYCEDRINETSQFVQVEHFRPKLGVYEADDTVVARKAADGSLINHPGYFWLAYDWQNLLPSCGLCNKQPGKDDPSGKGNRFPLKPGSRRAFGPGDDLKAEEPLLLHPVFDDPVIHLTYDPKTGILGGNTDRGVETIRILGLNRDGLRDERKQAYRNALMNLVPLFTANIYALMDPTAAPPAAAQEYIEACEQGAVPFSFVCRIALKDARLAVSGSKRGGGS